MATFKPTILSVIPPPLTVESAETVKWRRAVEKARIVKEVGGITGVDIHPVTQDVLVTASRIHMYDALFQDKKSFYANSHFTLFSASFRRPDGRLIVAGNQAGSVLVYDANSSKPLRDFNDPKTRHTGAVRKSLFYGRNQVLTFSDDKTVRLWDLADGRLLTQFGKQSITLDTSQGATSSVVTGSNATGTTSSIVTGSNAIGATSSIGATLCPRFGVIGSVSESNTAHTGYVRSGCIVDMSTCIASGSYDSTVKLWDPRGDGCRAVKEFSVDLPVESLFANKSLILVSAGKSVFVYDIIGGRILSVIKNCHTKTITCMGMYNQEYFMTGSLDGVLKVFKFDTLTEVTQFKHPSVQILSLATSDNSVVVGSSEGTVYAHCIKKSILEGKESDIVSKGEKRVSSDRVEMKEENVVVVDGNERSSRQKLRKCDKLLKNYQFTQALDSVVRNHYLKGRRCDRVHSDLVVSFMQELIRRDVLKRAMTGLKDKQLKRFLRFLTSNLQSPPFHRTLLDVTHAFFEVFASQITSDLTIDSDGKVTSEEDIGHYFLKLKSKIDLEFDTLDMMTSLAGQVKIIIDNS